MGDKKKRDSLLEGKDERFPLAWLSARLLGVRKVFPIADSRLSLGRKSRLIAHIARLSGALLLLSNRLGQAGITAARRSSHLPLTQRRCLLWRAGEEWHGMAYSICW